MSLRFTILIYLTCIIPAAYLMFRIIFKSDLRAWSRISNTNFDTLSSSFILDQHISEREDIFPRTDFAQSLTKSGRKFWNSTKPSFDCSEKKRVGRDGDGGKWTCGLSTLANHTLQSNYPCVIYSFGVAGESSFEEEILQVSHCQIFAYDMTANSMGPEIKKNNPRVHFRSLGITGNTKRKNLRTLKELMDSNGHSWIDLLKVDVEGAEYNSLDRVFTDFERLPFGQLLIELHSYGWKVYREKIMNVLKGLEVRGMRIFSVEPNTIWPEDCSEYALINIHALKLFGQDVK